MSRTIARIARSMGCCSLARNSAVCTVPRAAEAAMDQKRWIVRAVTCAAPVTVVIAAVVIATLIAAMIRC